MESKLKAMLDGTVEANSRNALPLQKIKQWLVGYIERYKEELTRFPEISAEPHFDLIMADYDQNREALFVVALFNGSQVSFVAGRGQAAAIRQFAETDFPENALEVLVELKKRFRLPHE